jgi:DNA-directed RNA polymerase specialized sigma24 family protein
MTDLNWTLDGPVGSPSFQTDWFAVHAAGRSTPEATEALDNLCRTYWYPLYAYVRRKGHAPQDAQDLTQEFFSRLLESPWLRDLHPSKGKFRSFLLASMNHFLANEWRRSQTRKRGGGREIFSLDGVAAEDCYRFEPSHHDTPDKIFERRWATILVERVVTRLQEEYSASGKGGLFEALKPMLDGEMNPEGYAAVAARLGTTEAAVKKAAQRLRESYRELLRAEVAQTVSDPLEIDEEMHHLFTALHG